MGVQRIFFYVFLFLIIIHSSTAEFTYGFTQDSGGVDINVENLPFGQSRSFSYNITNINSLCSMMCSVYLDSTFSELLPLGTYPIYVGDSLQKSVRLSAPTKEQAGYRESGSQTYELKVDCIKSESLFCDGNVETGIPSKTRIQIQYELSDTDKAYKSRVDSILPAFTSKIDSAQSELFESESKINAARGRILLLDLPDRVSDARSQFDSLSRIGKKVEDDYAKLDFISVLQYESTLTDNSVDEILDILRDVTIELSSIQRTHDSLVGQLNNLGARLENLNEDARILNHGAKIDSLSSDYKELQDSIRRLSFSSYEQLNSSVLIFKERVIGFEDETIESKRILLQDMSSILKTEYAKINSSTDFSLKESLRETQISFCSELTETLPARFSAFNVEKERLTEIEDAERLRNNEEIENLRPSYYQLGSIVSDIVSIANSSVFDVSLTEGCSGVILELTQRELSENSITSAITECTTKKDELKKNIAENQMPLKSFMNFFKYLFQDKPKLNQSILPPLESFMDFQSIIFTPVSFSSESEAISSSLCSIELHEIILEKEAIIGEIVGEQFTGGALLNITVIDGECSNRKCYDNRNSYPILFVHGHLLNVRDDPIKNSIETFSKMVQSLSSKTEMYDAGKIVSTGSQYLNKRASLSAKAPMFRTTYYGQSYIDSFGNYVFKPSKYESIDIYADKLNEIIDSTLTITDRKKVKIVAHSMGGLVTRQYLKKYGNEKVDTFIMIGTPNRGISGIVFENCAQSLLWTGSEVECSEMKTNSSLLISLSDTSSLPSRTYIIYGEFADVQYDGVVLSSSAKLDGIQSYKFVSNRNAQLTPTVHTELVEPSIMPEVTYKVLELLNS